MENYVAKYVKKYNMFDAADGFGRLVRLSVYESMFCSPQLSVNAAVVYGHSPGRWVSGWYLALNSATASSSVFVYLRDAKGTLCDVRYIFKRR